MASTASKEKQKIREQVWRLLEERGVAAFPRPVYGRIPNFLGAREAAARLAETPEWKRARVVKVNPDAPQKWVRLAALREGKLVVMASPRLREGFLLLDPGEIPSTLYEKAATIRGAFQLGRRITIDELRSMGGIDLVVAGSVAVDRRGRRVGKGEGYAEIEYGVMRGLGLIDENTPVATTIHDLQLVSHIPREPYDLAVDIVATPTRLIRFEAAEKPPGIIWDMLPCKKFREIPVLQELAGRLGVEKPCRE
ncbi:5-formyltetrahydrofolate cyclo-ligase [Pyrodictium occultum]|uniref:5-formyltetrahydrofolate cyclo-ligase n=1 Tax=Pyrodictium occultum TaxID=2309 RepID=A0A0V8RUN6_PYROC|nr:5-formyltetrahydrofolate cyclo-ligase [Pyrodictium occultum]KSW11777.1 5-formyltetrahydrofolate cyclo-ligase [Pyrodictium occultum]